MSTVTYKAQPAIERTKGKVALAGTSHLYRVKAILWPEPVQSVIRELLIPKSLHVCSGHSLLGDIRVDADSAVFPDVVCDAARLPFADQSLNSVLCDPSYNGRFQWNHDMLSELSRVARERVIFQHCFVPADRYGRWRKFHKFRMAAIYAWQPKIYFGRAQLVTVFDATDNDKRNVTGRAPNSNRRKRGPDGFRKRKLKIRLPASCWPALARLGPSQTLHMGQRASRSRLGPESASSCFLVREYSLLFSKKRLIFSPFP